MLTALRILRYALHLYSLLLVAHAIISWVHPQANRWTVMLDRAVEPVLEPTRRILRRFLPQRAWVVDWSPLAVFLAIQIVNRLLAMIR